MTISDSELRTQQSDCTVKAPLCGICHIGLSMVTMIFLSLGHFFQDIQTRTYVGSTIELYPKHGRNFIHFSKKTFIITWKLPFQHHTLHYISYTIVYPIARLLSTWMKGKSSPTAKLESQLTVPAIMNAAGLWDCWKNSPVRTNGIPPETGPKKSVVLVNFSAKSCFTYRGERALCCTSRWAALLYSSLPRHMQGLLSQSNVICQNCIEKCDTSLSHTTASPVLHPFSDGKQVTAVNPHNNFQSTIWWAVY